MRTGKQVRGFDHRGRGPEVARATAGALGLYPFSEEIVLSSLTVGDSEPEAAAFRTKLGTVAKALITSRRSFFHAVCCMSSMDGSLRAHFGVRDRCVTEPVWAFVARAHGLRVADYRNVRGEDPGTVAERILAVPLSAEGLEADAAAKVVERHLGLNGNLWLIKYGKPYFDRQGMPMRGAQEARERWLREGGESSPV